MLIDAACRERAIVVSSKIPKVLRIEVIDAPNQVSQRARRLDALAAVFRLLARF
jgi:hypothetical protein